MSYTITGRMHSESRFLSSDGKPVFIINKDGCHVPEGVSADEAAQVVIKRLNDHIQNLVKPLEKENAELKAKIADHIRAKDKVCSTLCHPDEECSITENGKCEAKGE